MEAITISKESETITITTQFKEIGTSHTLETTDKEKALQYFSEFITNKK
jgi:hypothetical protein